MLILNMTAALINLNDGHLKGLKVSHCIISLGCWSWLNLGLAGAHWQVLSCFINLLWRPVSM